jgi:hypothetical protein
MAVMPAPLPVACSCNRMQAQSKKKGRHKPTDVAAEEGQQGAFMHGSVQALLHCIALLPGNRWQVAAQHGTTQPERAT